MRVFVTGASGWIGSALLPELLESGHRVTGLARSDAAAAAIAAWGAEALRGTIDDLDLLKEAAESSDGVVHLAFKHDAAFSGGFEAAAEADRRAIETFGDALAGSGRPFVIASGVAGLKPGYVATEADWPDPEAGHSSGGVRVRQGSARLTVEMASRGIRSSIVRLAPTVHGDGDHGFMAAIVGMARKSGVSGYIGDGTNRWPAVHRLDAAHPFRLALEKAPAGSVLHAVGDEGVAIREIAEVIGRHLGLPVASIAPDKAADQFAWLAPFIALDTPASSKVTQKLFGWQPNHPGLIADLEEGHYFSGGARMSGGTDLGSGVPVTPASR